MCDLYMQQKIENKVIEFTNQGKMFSAWDVTKALRDEGTDVRHYEVRRIVRNMFDTDDLVNNSINYLRTSIGLSNGDMTFVYHLPGIDPDIEYPASVNFRNTVVSDPVVTPTDAKPASTMNQLLYADSRGRICVPAEFIKKINKTAGDNICVAVKQGCIILNPVSIGSRDRYWLIDDSRNIRIAPGTLKEANIDTSKVVYCNLCGNEIHLTN